MRLAIDPLAALRHERKHLLQPREATALEARIATAGCIEEPSNRIVTLYLDRHDAVFCRRLLHGKGAGTRLRVRWYGGISEPLVLERKFHRGGLVRKTRLACTAKDLVAILSGADPRGRRVGIGRLVHAPVAICVVGYERRVFRDAEGTFRLTVDRGLGAALPMPDWIERLAAGRIPEVPSAIDAPVVVECKFQGGVPHWLESALSAHEAPRFSKLAWAFLRLRRSA